MRGNQRAQLGDRVARQRCGRPRKSAPVARRHRRAGPAQLGLVPVLGGAQVQFGQPVGVDAGERRAAHIGQRLTAPQRRGLVQQLRGPVRVTGGEGLPAGRGEGGEAVGVDVVRFDGEPVAGRAELDRQRLAQPGHLRLQRVAGAGRRMRAVEAVDQPFDADRAARLEQQHGQQGPQAGAAEGDRPPVGVLRPERTQDAEPHADDCDCSEYAADTPVGVRRRRRPGAGRRRRRRRPGCGRRSWRRTGRGPPRAPARRWWPRPACRRCRPRR